MKAATALEAAGRIKKQGLRSDAPADRPCIAIEPSTNSCKGWIMNAMDWDSCDRPNILIGQMRGKSCDRKLRLFAIACCRRVSESLAGEAAVACLDSALKYSDGLCSDADLEAAREAAQNECNERRKIAFAAYRQFGAKSLNFLALFAREKAISAAIWAAEDFHPFVAESSDADCQLEVADGDGYSECEFEDPDDGCNYFPRPLYSCTDAASAIVLASSGAVSMEEEELQQCKLVREIFEDPLRPVQVNPAWRTQSVLDLAQRIYDQQAFERMHELAAILEAAGCDSKALLDHCRKVDGHVRGCWALDLLLQKE